MIRYRILDLDGCIANDEWRIPFIRWDAASPFHRYDHYHQVSPWDHPGNFDLFRACKDSIIVLTARPVLYRALTLEWLRRVECLHAHIIMRNNDDHRPSAQVKETQLLNLVNYYGVQLEAIDCAYDDRPEICEMYRRLGLRAEVRALHSASAYHNPFTGASNAA